MHWLTVILMQEYLDGHQNEIKLLNWKGLLSVSAWTPLKSVSRSLLNHLSGVLYQLADNVFVVAQPYDQSFIVGAPDAPFITMLYWVACVEAAKRCVLQETQFDSFPIIHPPAELLLGTDGSYGELVKLADSSAEWAVYKGSDGGFVHKVIAINNYSYFFLNPEIEYSQKPYAIEVSL